MPKGIMSKPRLHMGLVGFDNEDYLSALLRTRFAVLQWQRSSPEDADALWISGEAAELVHDDIVRVAGPRFAGAMTLDLQALDRPTFFSLPLRDERIRAPRTFDPRSARSVDKALKQAEAVLHPLVMQLALAHEIAERLPSLTAHTYHVTKDARLLAVVNMGGSVGFDLVLSPVALQGALWRPLPMAASAIPQHFLSTSFAEVLWRYVSRAEKDLLPARYRKAPLYFRALPRVPQRLMKETHYVILSELGAEPQTFEQLQLNIGLTQDALANALAVLYYAGAITTNIVRAAKGAAMRVREAESPSELRQSMFPSDASLPFSAFAGRETEDRATVPSPLEPPGPGR
jgi:DNA-binding transcriptional ArsR family regulator